MCCACNGYSVFNGSGFAAIQHKRESASFLLGNPKIFSFSAFPELFAGEIIAVQNMRHLISSLFSGASRVPRPFLSRLKLTCKNCALALQAREIMLLSGRKGKLSSQLANTCVN